MKKIRTILAYYNGEKFIDEQLQSIVDQEIPEGYEHEIYVYDDGSKKESLDYLKKAWGSIAKIISRKNSGPFFVFMNAMLEAAEDGVDIIFLSDQDDIFLPGKYTEHIAQHENGFSLVSSNAFEWYWSENRYEKMRYNQWLGHRLSVKTSVINVDLEALKSEIKRINMTKFSINYHDTLLGKWFAILGSIKFIDKPLTLWRKNSESATYSVSKETHDIWKDQYGYFYEVLRPFWEKIYGEKLSIHSHNKGCSVFDENYFRRKMLAQMKMYWNDFWMYLHVKAMRNI